MTDFKRILIINPHGIGDVLFTTPFIQNLRQAYPLASIAYLSNSRCADFLQKNPDITRVFVYSRDEFVQVWKESPLAFIQKWLAFFKEIKDQNFDLVFDFSLNSTFGFLAMASGIKTRVGFDYRKRGRFFTHRLLLTGYEEKHVVEYYLDLLGLVHVPVKTRAIRLDVPASELKIAQAWLQKKNIAQGRPVIALLPGGGASWGKSAFMKRWPARRYAQLIDKIIEKSDAAVILLGDVSEEELCRQVKGLVHFPVIDAVGQTSVLGLAAILKYCSVVIVNDGGPLHVAEAVATKTVSIFGPVDPLVYGPYPLANHVVVQKNLPCQPCYRRFRMASCGHISCLAELSVEEVYRKVQSVL
ncbi:MAG: glycosyltransferase family 9 protein [Candidatus Omnitrophica bacterium]|nr:glycosyltransferase family 9 protein [Candidatus Omnitrophota bacterium]